MATIECVCGMVHSCLCPKPVDWSAVARDAAVAIAARRSLINQASVDTVCSDALALVAEMKKRDGFGGGK